MLTIARGTQGSFDSLDIGLGSTSSEDYANTQEVRQRRLIAHLSMHDRGDNSINNINVFRGQNFDYHGYALYTERIHNTKLMPWDPSGVTGGGSIRLRIKKP